MARKKAVKLNLDMAYMSLMRGNIENISGDPNAYATLVEFVLGIDPSQCKLGQYQVELENGLVVIAFTALQDAQGDPIITLGKGWNFGVSGEGVPNVPFEAFTDNRGAYPATLVQLQFPYRLASWMDPSHASGLKMGQQYEDMEVLGLPRSEDKIAALKAVNKLLRTEPVLGPGKTLTYDEVTIFTEVYFRKGIPKPSLIKLEALASERAYKDAVEDYLLEGFDQDALARTITRFKSQTSAIDSETGLLSAVNAVISDVLAFHIENRRWVEAFWDGARTINHAGAKISVPRRPKNETRIQPTIHVILDMALRPLGVQVIRESDEGIGSLDFRCLYTTSHGEPLSVGIEFKLAHHKEIKHGLRSQLPAYLRALRSKSGIFCVMWFKDKEAVAFDEPAKYDIDGFKQWLQEEAAEVSMATGFALIPSVIDASVKVSASKFE